MTQFLLESVILTILGGVIGIALGALLAGLIYAILLRVLDTGWYFSFPLSSIIISVAVAAVTGTVFGIYPARQAAKKSPIEALRYE